MNPRDVDDESDRNGDEQDAHRLIRKRDGREQREQDERTQAPAAETDEQGKDGARRDAGLNTHIASPAQPQ